MTFDFNKDVEELYKAWGADINALSADLSAFRKRGGKLITYHGWQDTTVSPFDSINYYDRLSNAKTFVRLFMVPGMDHCQNGPGLDSFGTRAVEGQLADPEHNMVSALDRWVTAGVAPEHVIATKWSGGFGGAGRGGGEGFSGGRGGSGGAAGRGPAVAEVPAAPPANRACCSQRDRSVPTPKSPNTRIPATIQRPRTSDALLHRRRGLRLPAPEYLVNSGAFGH